MRLVYSRAHDQRQQFRSLCPSLADASVAPHFDRVALRTPRRIFATMAPDELSANLMINVDGAVGDHEGEQGVRGARQRLGWGRKGATMVTFADVDESHARAMVKRSAKKK